MEIRKVQKLGYSTIVVSLPRIWVKEKGLKKGDNVIIRIEDDGSLRIVPYNDVAERGLGESYVVDVSKINSKGLISRILIGSYLVGHDNISFQIEGKRLPYWVIDEIQSAINRLAGVQIVDQSLNRVTVQCLIDSSKFKLNGLIRRIYTLIFSMVEAIKVYLGEGDKSIMDQVDKMEDEADRVYWLTVRQLLLSQKSWRLAKDVGIEHPYHIVGNRAIVKSLEEIADRLYDISLNIRKVAYEKLVSNRDALDKLIYLLDYADRLIGDSMQALIELNLVRANDLLNNLEEFKEEVQEIDIMFLNSLANDFELLSTYRLIVSHILRIADSVDSIAEITINRALETPEETVKWIKEVKEPMAK